MRALASLFGLISSQAWATDHFIRAPWRAVTWLHAPDIMWVVGVTIALIVGWVLYLLRGDRDERRLGSLLAVFLLVGISLNAKLAGTVWFVRSSTDCANNGDGTAYTCASSGGGAGAWRTLASVQWGVGNVDTGDTLKLGGTFVVADADTAFGFLSSDQAGATIDGDTKAWGGPGIATLEGGGTFDSGIRCDSPNCAGQTWKNILAKNFDVRGFYFRNAFSAAATANFTGVNLRCEGILGADASTSACVQGWGVTASITQSSSIRTSDDAFHWEGPNFSLTESYCKDPGYGSDSNMGDCVQVAIDPDNAYIAQNIFDKSAIVSDTRLSTKQAIAITDVGSADNATIVDNTILMPLTGNATNAAKCIYSEVPGAVIQRNYCLGGYEQIFVAGANSVIRSNIAVLAESKAYNLASTVSSGTHIFQHNVGARTSTCADLNGGASVTVTANNNLMLSCALGYTKGGSNTVNQTHNAGFNNTSDSAIGSLAVTADPKLVGGSAPVSAGHFCLSSDSPLIGAGTYIGSWVRYYNKAPQDNPVTIGALGASCSGVRIAPTIRIGS